MIDQKITTEELTRKAWQAPELTLRGEVKGVTANKWGGSGGGNGNGNGHGGPR